MHIFSKSFISNGNLYFYSGHLDLQNVGIQVGHTKVFLRSKAFDILEKLRMQKIFEASITIQKICRRFIAQSQYWKAILSILTIQCHVRKFNATNLVQTMREKRAATAIQSMWRKKVAMHSFIAMRFVAGRLQCLKRGQAGRERYNRLNKQRKAIKIQQQYRRFICVSAYSKVLSAIKVIQMSHRCYRARVVLHDLRMQERNLHAVGAERNALKQLNNELKAEVEALRKELQANEASTTSSSSLLQALREEAEYAGAELERSRIAEKAALETVDELSTEADKLKLEVQDLQICNEETASKLELSTKEVKRLQESTVMIAVLQKQQTESEQIIAELEKDLEESKGLVQVAKVEVTDNNHDAPAIKDEEITRLKNELKMLRQISPTNQKELSGLPEDPLDSEEMEVLKDELKEANKKITILQKRVSRSNSSSQVVALKKELEEARAVISRLKEQSNENQAASESTSESDKSSWVWRRVLCQSHGW